MIVEMRRVLVFGPNRLLRGVVEEIQRLGALHIEPVSAEEPAIGALRPDEAATAAQSAIERARARAANLLNLLPAIPSAGEAGSVPPSGRGAPPGESLVDTETLEDSEALDALLEGIEAEVGALTRRRLDAEDELEMIQTYEGAVRALSPLLGVLSGSRSLESLGFILRGRDLSLVTAVRNQLRELTGGRVEVVGRIIEEGRIGVVVAFLHRDAETIRAWLTRAGISELRLPARYAGGGPAEAVRTMERRRAELPGEMAEIASGLAEAARRSRPLLEAVLSLASDRLGQFRALSSLAQSRYTFILHGWAPASRVREIREALRARFGREVVVHDQPADHHHAEAVPVLLDNPPVIKPFQRLLGLFRPPRYGTLDPTVYLAFFFPIFVGMVIGDVAYGALLFALGWWMRQRARSNRPWDVALGSIKMGIHVAPSVLADISWIVRTMAAWTILFGVLYLEVFGNLVEHHLGLHPIFNRVHLTTAFLGLAVAMGIVQVMLGYLLHLVLALRHRHAFGALESLAMMTGVAALFALLGAMGNVLPSSFFTPGVFLLVAFLVAVMAGIAVSPHAAMWLLEAISGMGNVLSYARLFGVGLAAAVLANVSNELGGMFGPVWIGIILGIFVQMIFFAFTLAGHIIQPARLNWVEFLTKIKYHDEGGNSYRPLHKTGGGL